MVMPVDEDFYDGLINEVADGISGLSLGFGGDDEEEDEFFEDSAPQGQPKDDADPKYQDKPTEAEAVFIFILYTYWYLIVCCLLGDPRSIFATSDTAIQWKTRSYI